MMPVNDSWTIPESWILPDEYFILIDVPDGSARYFRTETDVHDFIKTGALDTFRNYYGWCKLLHIEAGTHFYTERRLDKWLHDNAQEEEGN